MVKAEEMNERNGWNELKPLVQGQMKAMSVWNDALGRPLSLMPHRYLGDWISNKRVGINSRCHTFLKVFRFSFHVKTGDGSASIFKFPLFPEIIIIPVMSVANFDF
jgi:hypothetical protein